MSKFQHWQSRRWRRHAVPILVWLAAVACVMVLFRYRISRYEWQGMATSQELQVAATTRGRLKTVPVKLLDLVKRGQILALLDDTPLQASLATARAEIEQLQTESKAVAERLNLQDITTSRRFSLDVEQARLRILELKTILEPDRIALRELELENEAAKNLQDKGLVSPLDMEAKQVNYEALARKIAENESLLVQARRDLEVSQRRLQGVEKTGPGEPAANETLEVTRQAIHVQEQRILELEVERDALVLTAPFDGVITHVAMGEGAAVMPGDPILTVVASQPREVVVYAFEGQADIQLGMRVKLIRYHPPVRIAETRVIKVGAAVVEIPDRLRRHPELRQWGRPFLVAIPPGLKLMPGEIVGVRDL